MHVSSASALADATSMERRKHSPVKAYSRATGRRIGCSYPGGPVRVAYAAEGYVAEEAAEIAQGNPHAVALLPCDARFEVLIDDLDAALDEYSTLFAVQEALENATGGFLFNTWNGQFPGRVCNP